MGLPVIGGVEFKDTFLECVAEESMGQSKNAGCLPYSRHSLPLAVVFATISYRYDDMRHISISCNDLEPLYRLDIPHNIVQFHRPILLDPTGSGLTHKTPWCTMGVHIRPQRQSPPLPLPFLLQLSTTLRVSPSSGISRAQTVNRAGVQEECVAGLRHRRVACHCNMRPLSNCLLAKGSLRLSPIRGHDLLPTPSSQCLRRRK